MAKCRYDNDDCDDDKTMLMLPIQGAWPSPAGSTTESFAPGQYSQ